MTTSRKHIVDAMAIEIWSKVLIRLSPKGRPFTHVPRPAIQAAGDLVTLYEDMNPGRSIVQIASSLGKVDPGRYLAAAAIDSTPLTGVNVPEFTVQWNEDEQALSWDGSSEPVHANPPKRHPETKSIPEVREILASRDPETKCHPTCQGWDVFDTNKETEHEGFEIEVCDECNSAQPQNLKLRDDDVEQLPEAQLALAKTLERLDAEEREEVEGQVREIHGGKVVPRGNPGEQWYRVSWTLKNGKKDSGVYPHSYLETFLRHLRSDYGLSDHEYTVKPENVRHGRPPGVPEINR